MKTLTVSLALLALSGCSTFTELTAESEYRYRAEVTVLDADNCIRAGYGMRPYNDCRPLVFQIDGKEPTTAQMLNFVPEGRRGFVQCTVDLVCQNVVYAREAQRDTPPMSNLIPLPWVE